MKVKKSQKFESKQSMRKIRVLKIVVRSEDSRYDCVQVANIDNKNKMVPGTTRVIYADSIRRRYNQI
jgi:hypothetical protein